MEQVIECERNANHFSGGYGLTEPLPVKADAQSGADAIPNFLEFFAGSGLVAEGMKNAFRAVWANDVCPKKAAVYRANHGHEIFHLGSITEINGCDLPAAALAWASFPCQDLSLAGLTGGIHASRSGLVWEWLRIIDEMPEPPPVLAAENVAGLVSVNGGENYKILHKALVARGYRVGAMLIDAVHWLPQSRPRIFVVAVRSGCNIPPSLVSATPTWLHPESVRKAAQALEGWVWWHVPPPPPRRHTISDVVEWEAGFLEPTTDSRNISLISQRHREILNNLPPSKPWVMPGYRRTRNGKQVLELRFDGLSGCLRTPEGGSSRQFVIIKQGDRINSRLITIREAARLMGAPDEYQIPGAYNDGYKAMGDAVAVPVVQWLAQRLLSPLVRAYEQH